MHIALSNTMNNAISIWFALIVFILCLGIVGLQEKRLLMYLNELSSSGSYCHSFFQIAVDTSDDVISLTNEEHIKTVVHEYIHFLQNLFTTYGIVRTIHVYDQISCLYHLEKETLNLPINIRDVFGSKSAVSINHDLFECYCNQVDNTVFGKRINSNEFDTVHLEHFSIEVSENPKIDVDTITIKLLKGNDVVYEFPFGASSLIECMASLFEKHLFPDKSMTYCIPYDLPLIFLQFTCPSLAKPKALFFICF